MASNYASFSKAFNKKIHGKLNSLVSKSLQRTLSLLESKVKKANFRMFKELSLLSSVFNSAKAPSFRGISMPQPQYDPLSETYKRRKQNKFRGQGLVGGASYYMFTGKLQKYFAKANPETIFGKPIISYLQAGRNGSYSKNTISSNSRSQILTQEFFNSKNRPMSETDFVASKTLGKFEIDLYPKIAKLTSNINLKDYFPEIVADKLNNYQGEKNRQFMPQYMEWWTKIRMKQLLKG